VHPKSYNWISTTDKLLAKLKQLTVNTIVRQRIFPEFRVDILLFILVFVCSTQLDLALYPVLTQLYQHQNKFRIRGFVY